MLLFAGLLAGFPLVALLAQPDAAEPVARARAIIELEASLGLFVEPAAHAWARARPQLSEVASWLYLFAHLPALGGALVWTWLERPRAYPVLRNVVLVAQALTFALYVALPTAPPRLVGDPRFGDTLGDFMGSSGSAMAHTVQSQYAALPSGHVVFALLAGGAVVLLARPLVIRVLAALYPPLVVAITIITANHFWLDAAAAVVVVGVAWAVVAQASRSRSARSVDQNARSSHGIALGANARTSVASGVVLGSPSATASQTSSTTRSSARL